MENKKSKLEAAERLYFQTELSASEIAEALGVPRRTIHYWINHESWDRMKTSANAMPCLLMENCYILLGKVTNDCLAPGREHDRVQSEEVNNITKLSLTINRLGKRITLNESFEMRNNMLEYVYKQNPDLALELEPIIDQYLKEKSRVQPYNFMGKKTTDHGMLTPKDKEKKLRETQLDIQDNFYWHDNPPMPETNPEIFEPLYASSPLYADLKKAQTQSNHLSPALPALPTVASAQVGEASAKVGLPAEALAKAGLPTEASAKVGALKTAGSKNNELAPFLAYLIANGCPVINPDAELQFPDLSIFTPEELDRKFIEFHKRLHTPATANPSQPTPTPTQKPTQPALKQSKPLNRAQRRALEKQNKKAA